MAIAVFYTVALLTMAYVWNHYGWPSEMGLIPIAVPWFGALGTVTRSLDGLFFHGKGDWSVDYHLWHVTAPLLGFITGTVTYVLLYAGLSTIGGGNKDGFGYYAAAFLTGYNNDQFRALLAKAGHALFGTPGSAGDPSRPGVPHSVDHPSSAANAVDSTTTAH